MHFVMNRDANVSFKRGQRAHERAGFSGLFVVEISLVLISHRL